MLQHTRFTHTHTHTHARTHVRTHTHTHTHTRTHARMYVHTHTHTQHTHTQTYQKFCNTNYSTQLVSLSLFEDNTQDCTYQSVSVLSERTSAMLSERAPSSITFTSVDMARHNASWTVTNKNYKLVCRQNYYGYTKWKLKRTAFWLLKVFRGWQTHRRRMQRGGAGVSAGNVTLG